MPPPTPQCFAQNALPPNPEKYDKNEIKIQLPPKFEHGTLRFPIDINVHGTIMLWVLWMVLYGLGFRC